LRKARSKIGIKIKIKPLTMIIFLNWKKFDNEPAINSPAAAASKAVKEKIESVPALIGEGINLLVSDW
jgi:hypothetical protein